MAPSEYLSVFVVLNRKQNRTDLHFYIDICQIQSNQTNIFNSSYNAWFRFRAQIFKKES